MYRKLDAAETYQALRESCVPVRPEPTTLFEFSGQDVVSWLQGQATNDLRKLLPEFSLSFCLCRATGQIEAVCTAWRLGDSVFVAVPEPCAPVMEKRVETMVILEDVQVRRRKDLHLLSFQGPSSDEFVAEGVSSPALEALRMDGDELLLLRHDHSGFGGWDMWSKEQQDDRYSDASSLDVVRIEAGLPLWGKDIGPKTLPAEMGPAFESRHVSYDKGCYVGQEVLMRMHSRGRANWDWMGLVAESPIEVGASLSATERADAGTVTSVAVSPRLGPIGAARVRKEIAIEGQEVSVGGVKAWLRAFPIA